LDGNILNGQVCVIEPSPEIQVVTQLAMVPLLRRSGFGVPDSVWLLAVMGIDSGQLRNRGKIWKQT